MSDQEPVADPRLLTRVIARHPSDLQVVDKFRQYVDEVKQTGVNGYGERVQYVTLHALESYWSLETIRSAIFSAHVDAAPINVEIIRDKYLRCFSILVYGSLLPIDWTSFTQRFPPDRLLPRQRFPASWAVKISCENLEAISQYQWLFFPANVGLEELHNSRLAPKRILPIHGIAPIKEDEDCSVHRVTVDPLCHNFGKGLNIASRRTTSSYSSTAGNEIVLKTYNNETYRHLYDNEIRAFTLLQSNSSENIVQYYGSFEHNGKSSVLLESSEATLQEYLSDNVAPNTFQDCMRISKQAIGLAEAIAQIHQLQMAEDGGHSLIHGDLRPENILVFRKDSFQYNVTFKIADFGLSQVGPVDQCDANSIKDDTHRGQVYPAPERALRDTLQEGQKECTRACDIWSLGMVFMEILDWLLNEPESLCCEKITSTRNIGELADHLHDAERMMPEMDTRLRHLHMKIGNLSNPNATTRGLVELVELVEKHMLVRDVQRRITASALVVKLEDILSSPNLVRTVFPISGTDSRNLPPLGTMARAPNVSGGITDISRSPKFARSVSRIVNRRLPGFGRGYCTSGLCTTSLSPLTRPKKKSFSLEDAALFRDLQSSRRPIPGTIQEEVGLLRTAVRGRDHIFIIDDSWSGGSKYWDEIANTVSAIHGLLSRAQGPCAPDKSRLVFGSQPHVVVDLHQEQMWSDSLLVHQRNVEWKGDFAYIVDNAILPRLPKTEFGKTTGLYQYYKPRTLIVLTDGAWQDERDGRANASIRKMLKEVSRRKLGRSTISIQFVQIGAGSVKDPLRFLDDCDPSDHR